MVYLLSDYSVNKVTVCSTEALPSLKHEKLLIGSMAKRALCDDTVFCHALSDDTQPHYSLKLTGAAAHTVP